MQPAKVNDPKTWMSFEFAANCAQWLEDHRGLKVYLGFVFSNQDPYCCLDLDWVDGETQAKKGKPVDPGKWTTAEQVADYQKTCEIFNTYTEVSSGGKGLHLIFKAKLPEDSRKRIHSLEKGNVEIYDNVRYLIFSGQVYIDEDIAERQDRVNQAVDNFFKKKAPLMLSESLPEEMSDEAVLQKITTARNSAKFNDLYAGRWEDYGKSQSEADLAFFSMLIPYSRNAAQMERIFVGSGLFRGKAKGPNYIVQTLSHALALAARDKQLIDSVDMSGLMQQVEKLKAEIDTQNVNFTQTLRETVVELTPGLDKFTNHDWPYGLIGKLAKLVYTRFMEWPNKEIAIIAARHTVATLQGRRGSFNGLKPQTHTVLLAPQAVGKETLNTTLELCIEWICHKYELSEDYIPENKGLIFNMLGSRGSFGVKALVRRFKDAPSLSILLGEAGIRGKSEAGDPHGLKGFFLSNLVKKAYSLIDYKDYAEHAPPVFGTVFQLLEESTLDSYRQRFKVEALHTGEFARQQVIFVDPKLKPFEQDLQVIDQEVYMDLYSLAMYSIEGEDPTYTITLGAHEHTGCSLNPVPGDHRVYFRLSPEAQALDYRLKLEEEKARALDETYEDNEWGLNARARAKALTEAFLYAQAEHAVRTFGYGEDVKPVITLEMFESALKFVAESDAGFKKNFGLFEGDDLVVFNELVKQVEAVSKRKHNKGKHYVTYRDVTNGNSTLNRLAKGYVNEKQSYKTLIDRAAIHGHEIGYWVYISSRSPMQDRVKYNLQNYKGNAFVLDMPKLQ